MKRLPKVKWIPNWGQKRIELMVGNRPDWCISRQRYWGSPITLFVNKHTGELHPDTESFLRSSLKRLRLRVLRHGLNLMLKKSWVLMQKIMRRQLIP